jgi:hypothetical protein
MCTAARTHFPSKAPLTAVGKYRIQESGFRIQATVILRSSPFLLADDEGSRQFAGRGRQAVPLRVIGVGLALPSGETARILRPDRWGLRMTACVGWSVRQTVGAAVAAPAACPRARDDPWHGRDGELPADGRSELASCPALLLTAGSLGETPSPGPPRLKKTPAAAHPLPQGGEGEIVNNYVGQDTSWFVDPTFRLTSRPLYGSLSWWSFAAGVRRRRRIEGKSKGPPEREGGRSCPLAVGHPQTMKMAAAAVVGPRRRLGAGAIPRLRDRPCDLSGGHFQRKRNEKKIVYFIRAKPPTY